ncbi:MAG: aminoglycoside phosphotransferase family protein [Anaerolineales bacterium]|nr:aminoglycoside phosphotransferase family protein [Anaerolineales bacterium]
MSDKSIQFPERQKSWFEQASNWIHDELERQDIYVTGLIERPDVSPSSSVLLVPSTAGDIYFKACVPGFAHEPALTDSLWRWRPDCMPPVLAVDLQRGWMLTPDLGVPLRSIIQPTRVLQHWRRVLPLFAEVQIDLASRINEILELGGLDRRLTMLPDQYEQLLTDTDALRLGHPGGLSAEEYRSLRQFAPKVRAMCELLAGYRIPETLHHEDFHDANIFIRNSHYTFADWGESGVAHPFFTLLVTSRVIAWRLKLAEDAPELMQLRDIYLEPWTQYESRENLIAAFKLAYRLGMICRALTWHRILAGMEEPVKAEDAEAVPGWLLEFLNCKTTPTV